MFFCFKIHQLLYNYGFKFLCIGEILYIKEFSTHHYSDRRWMEFMIMTTNSSIPPEYIPRSLVDTQISCSVHWTIISLSDSVLTTIFFPLLFPSLSMLLSHLSNQDNVSRKLLTANTDYFILYLLREMRWILIAFALLDSR